MKERHYRIMFAAAVFGAIVWLSVSLREQYQVTVQAPLAIEEIPSGWAIRTPLPPAVQLKYRGDGWRLLFLVLGSEIKLSSPYASLAGSVSGQTADASLLPSPATARQARSISLFDLADRMVSRPGIELVSVTPDSFLIGLDRYEEKRVPVAPDLTLSFREGYGQVGGATVVPDSITLGGAASVLAAITTWPTISERWDDLRLPVEQDVPLSPSVGYQLTFSTPQVHVSLNVQPFAEKTFPGIVVAVPGAPSDREVILIPPKIEIVARAGIRKLAALEPGEFRVFIDYQTILADSTGMIEPTVIGPPEVQVVSRRPDRCQYIVRRKL